VESNMLERKITIPILLTPEELAFEFCNMGNNKQAIFFNEVSEISSKWEKPFCFQLQSIIDDKSLTQGGRKIMESIGEYGENNNQS